MFFIPGWALGVAVIIFAIAAAQILVVKMRASSRLPPPPDKEIGELRQALDATQDRLGELEERVDFAERLLTRYRQAERLEPPKD